jgi:carbon monoxide dehydrogenase subunit G
VLIENDFAVAGPPDEVYRTMLDVQRVAPCIPGAQVTGVRDDGAYDAQVTVKMGPVTMAYRGSVAIVEHDDAARTATMRAKAAEARGQGTAQATMAMAVRPGDTGSQVHVSTDLLVTGRVAQMGRGIMEDVATRMIGDMARCLEHRLAAPAGAQAGAGDAPPPAAKPVSGLRVLGSALVARLRRLFHRR